MPKLRDVENINILKLRQSISAIAKSWRVAKVATFSFRWMGMKVDATYLEAEDHSREGQ